MGDVIADCWCGWEEKLQLVVVAEVHKHLHLPEVVLGSDRPEGMPGQGISNCALLWKCHGISYKQNEKTINHQTNERGWVQG